MWADLFYTLPPKTGYRVVIVKIFQERTPPFIFFFFHCLDHSLNTSTLTSLLPSWRDSLKPAKTPQERNFLNSRKAWVANNLNKLRRRLVHGNTGATQDPGPESPTHDLGGFCQAVISTGQKEQQPGWEVEFYRHNWTRVLGIWVCFLKKEEEEKKR